MIAVVLIATVPPVLVVKLVKAFDPPITPESVVVPVVLRVKVKPPFTVPPNVILPEVFPERVVFVVKTTGVSESPRDIRSEEHTSELQSH